MAVVCFMLLTYADQTPLGGIVVADIHMIHMNTSSCTCGTDWRMAGLEDSHSQPNLLCSRSMFCLLAGEGEDGWSSDRGTRG